MKTFTAGTAVLVLLLVGCQTGGSSTQSTERASPVPTTAAAPTTPSKDDGGVTTPPVSPVQPPKSPELEQGEADALLPAWSEEDVEGEPGGQAPSGGQEITGVRIGAHEDFDRVVLDLSGAEPALGWYARFQDEAIHDPSGLPFDIEGDVFLDIGVRGIDWVKQPPERYSGDEVTGEGTEVVTAVVFGGLFEGQQQVLIGLRRQTAFRIFTMSEPARIVVDVRRS